MNLSHRVFEKLHRQFSPAAALFASLGGVGAKTPVSVLSQDPQMDRAQPYMNRYYCRHSYGHGAFQVNHKVG